MPSFFFSKAQKQKSYGWLKLEGIWDYGHLVFGVLPHFLFYKQSRKQHYGASAISAIHAPKPQAYTTVDKKKYCNSNINLK
jgi:hypothetical protein